jgi:hypothetical protein
MATLSEIRENPQAQRKLFIFAGVLLFGLGWLLLPLVLRHHSADVQASARQQAIARAAAIRAASVAPVAAPAPAVPLAPSALPDPYSYMLGKWSGQAVLMERGTCGLLVELHEGGDKSFSGFSTLSCAPTVLETMAREHGKKLTPAEMVNETMKDINPASASFTGVAKDGAILLQAVDNVGVSQTIDRCEMLSMSLRGFGDGRLSVKWQEKERGVCHCGEMVLPRK